MSILKEEFENNSTNWFERHRGSISYKSDYIRWLENRILNPWKDILSCPEKSVLVLAEDSTGRIEVFVIHVARNDNGKIIADYPGEYWDYQFQKWAKIPETNDV